MYKQKRADIDLYARISYLTFVRARKGEEKKSQDLRVVVAHYGLVLEIPTPSTNFEKIPPPPLIRNSRRNDVGKVDSFRKNLNLHRKKSKCRPFDSDCHRLFLIIFDKKNNLNGPKFHNNQEIKLSKLINRNTAIFLQKFDKQSTTVGFFAAV